MKKLILFAGIMMGLVMASCGGKSDNKAADPVYTDTEGRDTTVRVVTLRESERTDTIDWNGRKAIVSISSKPDENGDTVWADRIKYCGNKSTLRIKVSGSTLVDKTYGKADFKGYIDGPTYERYILFNMIYEKQDGSDLVFSAAVGNPNQDDEYIPMKVRVSPSGAVSVSKSNDMGMNADDEMGD